MAEIKGLAGVSAFISAIPAAMQDKIGRTGARAGARVIVDEIGLRTPSDDVRENLRIRTKVSDGVVGAIIDVRTGWARAVGIWLEWGTAPHYITVDDSQRQGMSAGRINRLGKEGTLVINGQPVGKTVLHPGARAQPAFRPALDTKRHEALAAAQAAIDARIARSGLGGADIEDADP